MISYKREILIVCISVFVLLVSVVMGVSLGSTGSIVGSGDIKSLLDLRIPRVIVALIAGGALSIGGSALQAVLENPLAEPYLLGVSGGAVLGGTFGIIFWNLFSELPYRIKVFSSAGAFGSIFLLIFLNRVQGGFSAINMLLSGIVFNGFVSSIVTLFKSIIPASQLQKVTLWLSGYISYFQFEDILIETVLVFLFAVLLVLESGKLNILSMGEDIATTSGINVNNLRLRIFLYTSLLTGVVVSITGLVGFVGLIIPQSIRSIGITNNRFLLPLSFILGGAFMILCDLLCRLISGSLGLEPPISAITAIIGGPIFIILLRKYYKERGIS